MADGPGQGPLVELGPNSAELGRHPQAVQAQLEAAELGHMLEPVRWLAEQERHSWPTAFLLESHCTTFPAAGLGSHPHLHPMHYPMHLHNPPTRRRTLPIPIPRPAHP